MAQFKIFYDSKKVKDNFLFINAKNATEAKNKFPEIYRDNGGDLDNIKKVKDVLQVYTVTFTGRKIHASGKFYKIKDTVLMNPDATEEEINIKLYDNYEHISNFKILK